MTFEQPSPEPTDEFIPTPETAPDPTADRPGDPSKAGTDLPLVVVSVGTDHHRFERLVNWMDEWARDNRRVRVIVQRGAVGRTVNAESHALIPHPELCALFAEATAVVIHGGPSSVMDARAAGRLPIVMPRNPEFGEHVDGHQMRFGEHIARHKLARVVNDRDGLIAAIDDALAEPTDFSIPIESGVAPGVAAFGRVVDDLLGSSTPLIAGEYLPATDQEAAQ